MILVVSGHVTGHRGNIHLYFQFEMKNHPFCLLWSRQTHVARRMWCRDLCQPQSCNYSSGRNSSSIWPHFRWSGETSRGRIRNMSSSRRRTVWGRNLCSMLWRPIVSMTGNGLNIIDIDMLRNLTLLYTLFEN